MKCENCGKNEAAYHYSSNINGEITRKHLCAECAKKFERENDFFGGMDTIFRRMDRMFSDFFRGFEPMLGGFMPPMTLLPRPDRMMRLFPDAVEETVTAGDPPEAVEGSEKPEIKADGILARHRKINALREQMRKAAVAEEYEEAARLRDEIRALEAEDAA